MLPNEKMQRVAHHLQCTAVGLSDQERDAFARSAYNRYYYSVFLRTRDMFRQMNPDWSALPHATYPELLLGSVYKSFKPEWTRARRNGDVVLKNAIEQAWRSIQELAKIITTANSTRVVADYEPEEQVNFETAERFSLRSVDITEAHGWAARVVVLCKSILRVWKQINV